MNSFQPEIIKHTKSVIRLFPIAPDALSSLHWHAIELMIGRWHHDVPAEQTFIVLIAIQVAEIDESVAERIADGFKAFGSFLKLFANDGHFERDASLARFDQCIGKWFWVFIVFPAMWPYQMQHVRINPPHSHRHSMEVYWKVCDFTFRIDLLSNTFHFDVRLDVQKSVDVIEERRSVEVRIE